jgi:hypothetical protein
MPTTILLAGTPALVTIANEYSVSVLLTWERRQLPAGQPSLPSQKWSEHVQQGSKLSVSMG